MQNNISPEVYDILAKVVGRNIDNYTVSVHEPNKKGEGFLGQMIFVSLQNKKDGTQFNLVVKQAFSDKNIREFNGIRDFYLNEIYFYIKLWPSLMKFQEGIPEACRFTSLAKCYEVTGEEYIEKLVFENLKYQGYVMHDKKIPLEKEKMEFIFREYGKLHAISFAFEDLQPELFSKLNKGIVDVWTTFSGKEHFRKFLETLQQKCLESLKPGDDDAVIEIYKPYVNKGIDAFQKALDNGKYSAILHGDCWSNNMMFKYDNNGKLSDIRFLDFQLVRYGSPVCDLSYCLYSGGTKEIYDNLDHLLEIYYDSFSRSIRAYGCDPNKLFPLEALKHDWKKYCYLGVLMGAMIWRIKLTDNDDAVDLTDIATGDSPDLDIFFETKFDENAMTETIRDMILHLYNNNFI